MGIRNNKGQFVKGTHWRTAKPWWNKKWLYNQYVNCNKSAIEIAEDGGVTENAILYWLQKHNIKCRDMKEIRNRKHWGLAGQDNPMWGRKGNLNPRWLGGITPERQSFYISQEWKDVCLLVWKRDNATCRRCGLDKRTHINIPFHIHHIESFANKDLRSEINNLVLLCEKCHHFIHSRENIDCEYLQKK